MSKTKHLFVHTVIQATLNEHFTQRCQPVDTELGVAVSEASQRTQIRE